MADTLPALLRAHRDEIKTLLPTYLDVDRFIANAQTVASDPKLRPCSAESLYRCCLEAARKGWEVGGPEKHCAIVPFKLKSGGMTAILLPQWQGRAFTWHKSGTIRKLKADVVYTGDVFEIESGDEDRIIHRPDFAAPRTPKFLNSLDSIVGAYAIAWLASGERVHAFVSRSQIARTMENVKKKNEGELGFGWTDWLPEMCKKTAVHRLSGMIQPPPDMTPEQIDAWNRANVAEAQFDAETTGEELPPDNLPVKEAHVEVVHDKKTSAATPPAAGAPTPPATQVTPPPATGASGVISDDEAQELCKLWRSLHNGKLTGMSDYLLEHFEVEDAAELNQAQAEEFGRIVANG